MMDALCARFRICHQIELYTDRNGVVEETNKNIKKILEKMVETYKD